MHPSELRITLIELYATSDGRLNSPPARDVYSRLRLPARGTDLLAEICRGKGFLDTVALNPRYNTVRRGLDRREKARLFSSDVVGISAITRTAPQSYELADLLREANPAALIVFGGPHTTALPEEGLRHGDVIVMHEGDETLPDLLERVAEHAEKPDLRSVAGIAFMEDGREVRTTPRPFLSGEELAALPFARLGRRTLRGISHQVMNTARGCPWMCEYCSVIENFGRKFRFLPPARMFELFKHICAQSPRPIFVGDDIFTAKFSRVKEFCELILSSGMKPRKWFAQARVEASEDMDMLRLMRRAGCDRVFVGIESVNDATLKEWNKHSTLEKNRRAVQRFHEAKISVHGMFVLGSDADTVETVDQTIAFAKDLGIATVQFFPITPLPGTPLADRYMKDGRVVSTDWHRYDAHHALIVPRNMSTHELQRQVNRAHREFYTVRRALRQLVRPPAGQPVNNCLVGLGGKILMRQLVRSGKPHMAALSKLERWKKDLGAGLTALGARLSDMTGSWSGSLAQARRNTGEFIEDTSELLKRAVDSMDLAGRGQATTEFLDSALLNLRERCATLDLAEQRRLVLEYLDAMLETVRGGVENLREEFHPYCNRILEEVRGRLQWETETRPQPAN